MTETSRDDWEGFLAQWNQELLAYADSEGIDLPPDVQESGWLGYPGASAGQIDAAQARLGRTLPPSYRAFLTVTNGWRQPGMFIERLWPVEAVGWHYDLYPQRVESWLFGAGMAGDLPAIPDEEYLTYGDGQVSEAIREEYLKTALQISDYGDEEVYLLNPAVVTPEGEWEAWFFASWIPGAYRHPSFRAMMQAEYRSFQDQVAREAGRFRPADDPATLSAKLPGLVDELARRAQPFNQRPDASDPQASVSARYASGIVEALEHVAAEVRRLQETAGDPAALYAQLQALAETAARKAQQSTAQPDPLAFARLLLDLGKALNVLHESGKAEGYRQAAGVIEWFLGQR